MVCWQYCVCGKVVDEYEKQCHWCGRANDKSDEKEQESDSED
jgi:hypothetical protein